MPRHSVLFQAVAALLFALQSVAAFAPPTTKTTVAEKIGTVATTAVIAISTSPLVALAEEVADDYEYGAVSAPISVAWVGGIFAVLTALLPLALQGGEEAFEEMKAADKGKFGTGDSSALDRKRGRF
mmetsp:Transcript_4544/g.9775  ORF Transcript_4544/g.9775 Transcript_4544/m.9775 type:complete len:127 (+) Transcript_4544:291-671(+)|eukprot:CAMPEP_0201117980 /NCGR_PEP_ID=MMETSP0850-20130426/2068_1 /ASSEMBLY_ACC=CAM_ASM_000622 /TAXON_ID=183588 /ORGANISM="Pseudo-nitzschia fraudulenta, Strain WWA7" /LENGTH=126 /DNA_ID=CAMNT_0047382821 /DNA_START=238 /DNA_END=618 /DNA_ORIENTATION=+